MIIQPLQAAQQEYLHQTATLLFDAFQDWPSGWPTLEAAQQEVEESLGSDRLSRIAIDDQGKVAGWIGAIQSNPYLWELHPLAVRSDCRRQGLGRSLVQDLEQQVAQRGGVTLWLGTDDEQDRTSLSSIDLYPHVLDHLAQLTSKRGHPYEFYKTLGFSVVGVLPDANGWGKPDILMAKRVSPKA